MVDAFTGLGTLIIISLLAFAIGYSLGKSRSSKNYSGLNSDNNVSNIKSAPNETKVLFFPDPERPCHNTFKKMLGERNTYCQKRDCNFTHNRVGEVQSGLLEIFEKLNSATSSVDLCLFSINYEYLAKLLIHLHLNKGIKVRIITNKKSDHPEDDKIPLLQQAGIEIKVNDKDLMHNKFVIIDSRILIFGSVNWTGTGFLYNDESAIITRQRNLVGEFNERFTILWKKYNYRSVTSIETV